jgi:hypothetical protein
VSNQQTDGRNDFDFLHGHWTNRNRRLKARLQGCTEWEEFVADIECRPVLGGVGNVDTYAGTEPDGTSFNAMSVRIFNPATGLWSIWWADDRVCDLFPPVLGKFTDGVGRFEGTDVCDGAPVDVIFNWTDITPTSANWSQEFSADGGQTWEKNWEMFMTRIED